MSGGATRLRALRMLMVASAFWGLSFPTTKALAVAQQELLPASSSWFGAALCVVYRFAIATLVLLVLAARSLTQLTRLELEQGLGLGLFGGVGILLQVDGMAYTSASSSAFLTQCYCLWIPAWVAWREKSWPPAKVFLSCGLVMIGVAALANLNWKQARLGRGELETIAASLVFTGQILWLERPSYAGNNVRHFSLVMFVVMAAVGGLVPGLPFRASAGFSWHPGFLLHLRRLSAHEPLATARHRDRSRVDVLSRAGLCQRLRIVLAGLVLQLGSRAVCQRGTERQPARWRRVDHCGQRADSASVLHARTGCREHLDAGDGTAQRSNTGPA